jgi:hypothetical protein
MRLVKFIEATVALVLLFSTLSLLFFLAGCTISFQNISTHGTATDLVDETQTASPNVSPSMPGMIPVF